MTALILSFVPGHLGLLFGLVVGAGGFLFGAFSHTQATAATAKAKASVAQMQTAVAQSNATAAQASAQAEQKAVDATNQVAAQPVGAAVQELERSWMQK